MRTGETLYGVFTNGVADKGDWDDLDTTEQFHWDELAKHVRALRDKSWSDGFDSGFEEAKAEVEKLRGVIIDGAVAGYITDRAVAAQHNRSSQ